MEEHRSYSKSYSTATVRVSSGGGQRHRGGLNKQRCSPRSARYVSTAPAPLEPVSHLLPFPLAARHRDLPNAAPPAVVEPGQECVLQLQLLPLRLVLFSPSVGEL